MSKQMRRHEPTSTMRPPAIRRRPGQSETIVEYLDWREVVDARVTAMIRERREAFAVRFLGGAS